MSFCPFCGKELPSNSGRFCENCGKNISSRNEAAEPARPHDNSGGTVTENENPQGNAAAVSKVPFYSHLLRRKILVPVIAGGALLAVAGGAAFALMRSNGTNDGAPQTGKSAGALLAATTSSQDRSSARSGTVTSLQTQPHDSVPIAITDDLRAETGASGVVATLGIYFWGINNRDWQTVWRQLHTGVPAASGQHPAFG